MYRKFICFNLFIMLTVFCIPLQCSFALDNTSYVWSPIDNETQTTSSVLSSKER